MATLTFDSARYVGARIGIFDPSGVKVGRVSHLSNHELLVIAGEGALVRRVVDAVGRLQAEGGAGSEAAVGRGGMGGGGGAPGGRGVAAVPAAPTLRTESRSASIGGVKAT